MRGRVPGYRVPIKRRVLNRPSVETIPAYWHPGRPGVRTAPSWFMKQIEDLGWNEIEITWNPLKERWQVWARNPRMQHPICWGWRLLFVHQGEEGEYLPLDERVLARLYHASAMSHGNGRQYFERLVSEMARDKAKLEQDRYNERLDEATERGWDYTRIKNIGKGSKFTDYHA